MKIPFNRPDFLHKESQYVAECLAGSDLAGDGKFTAKCRAWLESQLGAPSLLTHSCTAALELAAMLSVQAGDEVPEASTTNI